MLSGDCNVCINGKMPSYSATCVECGLSRKHYKPMTNADKIRTMSVEEMAIFLANLAFCPECNARRENCGINCWESWLDWLKQEVEI